MTRSLFSPLPVTALLAAVLASAHGAPAEPSKLDHRGTRPMLVDNIDRALRYTPDGGDFVIVNGDESFNRPLYGGSSPFRVDGGDKPEFSFYLPGRGGNLRLGFSTPAGMKWLHDAARIEARYRGGSMVYEIRDPLLDQGALRVTAISPKDGEGLLVKVESAAGGPVVELHIAFGGISGERGGRDGDIGCERLPVREFFRFKPEYCKDNEILHTANRFVVRAMAGTIVASLPENARCATADANLWNDLAGLAKPAGASQSLLVAHARFSIQPGSPALMSFQHLPAKQVGAKSAEEVLKVYRDVSSQDTSVKQQQTADWQGHDLPARFERELKQLADTAARVSVKPPIPSSMPQCPPLSPLRMVSGMIGSVPISMAEWPGARRFSAGASPMPAMSSAGMIEHGPTSTVLPHARTSRRRTPQSRQPNRRPISPAMRPRSTRTGT